MNYFRRDITQLEEFVAKLSDEHLDLEELIDFDFETHILTRDLVFAVFDDEDVAIYWSLMNVASEQEEITDKLVYLVVDEIKMFVYNGYDIVLAFAKRRTSEEANELIESLL